MSDDKGKQPLQIEKIAQEFNDYSYRLSHLEVSQKQHVQDLIKSTAQSIEAARNNKDPDLLASAQTNVGYLKEFAHSELRRTFAVTKAVTNQRVAESRLQQIGTDELTGLANRASFNQQIKTAVEKTGQRATHDRFGNKHPDGVNKINIFALVAVDADNFKGVNDDYGHDAGDAILQVIADNLIKTTREDKNATLKGFGRLSALRDDQTTSRPGGDEFTIILSTQVEYDPAPDASPAETRQAMRKAIKEAQSDFDKALHRIREANKGKYAEYEGKIFPISLSMGMHRIRNNDTEKSAYKRADLASLKDKETKQQRWDENIALIRQQGLEPVSISDKRGEEKQLKQIMEALASLQNAGVDFKISIPEGTQLPDAVHTLENAGIEVLRHKDEPPQNEPFIPS